MSTFEIYEKKPEGYCAHKEVSVGFFHHEGKYLFLKRSYLEENPNTWCVPGGCVEPGETPLEGLIREAYEETGHILQSDKPQFIKTFYVETNSNKKRGFSLHLFYIELDDFFTPQLNNEHTDFQWLIWEEAEKLPLISGKGPAMQHYRTALEEFTALKEQ